MPRIYPPRSFGRLPHVVALVGLLVFPLALRAQEKAKASPAWADKALAAEKAGNWLDACRCYEELLRKQPRHTAAREGYQRCLRRLHLLARHNDAGYRQTLGKLKPNQALTTYEQVLQILTYAYPERTRSDLSLLFQNGLDEVKIALDDPVFRRHYLPGVRPASINAFKSSMSDWSGRKFTRTTELREQVGALIRQAGKDGLPIAGPLGSALVLEFAAGACNALDEHSSFLTPGHLALMQGTASRPRQAGIGVELTRDDNGLKITRVYKDGPADKSLWPNDRILRVDGQALEDDLTAEAANEKFRGKAGSSVEVEVDRKGTKHTVQLKRRVVSLPSVESSPDTLEDNTPIGYLRINHFTDDTFREVKDAIDAMLANRPIKAMILDLRGNPGGVFTSAVNVAELFLTVGVISVGQSTFPEYNKTFRSENPGSLDLPLVVLVDAETASAAEVLAAALKESRTPGRTVLMGQTTYGKGSIQCLIQLKKAPLDKMAGIRLTVAKLFSPSNTPITGRGITPDRALEADADPVLEAKKWLQEALPAGMMMMDNAVAKNSSVD